MGIFDFLFGKDTRQSSQNIQRKDDEKRMSHGQTLGNNIKADKQEPVSIEPFVFKSNCHQRYENGTPVMGLQNCLRTVCVEKNINGCHGYKLAPGIGYIVKIYNDDLGKPNMSDKPMKIVEKTIDKVELRGFPIEAQSPFGWQEIDNRDYGLTVYYINSKVIKCILHMFDRNVDLEYRKEIIEKGEFQKESVCWTKSISLDSIFKKSISFHAERYEIWQGGQCINKGAVNFDVHGIVSASNISFEIPNAEKFSMHKNVSFPFAGASILHDRVQYVNAPQASQDPACPIVFHIFVKDGKIDYIRFAMSFPDRIVEFYGYQIESATSRLTDFTEATSKDTKSNESYKLTFLSNLINIAACDGEVSEVEMQVIVAFAQREGIPEQDLVRVIMNPKSVPNEVPQDAGLRAQHLRDIVTLAMVDGHFSPREYQLCRATAQGIGFRPEVVDIIRKEINDQIKVSI